MSDKGEATPRTVFLLGAGASVAAGVPTAERFVTLFEERLDTSHRSLMRPYLRLRDRLRSWADSVGEALDVELLYDNLKMLSGESPQFLLDTIGKKKRPLHEKDATDLSTLLESFIREKVYVKQEAARYLEPILHFRIPGSPLEIFTTNYDTCIEQVCEWSRVRWQDGFTHQWDPAVFSRTGNEVHIRKLHGSVLWYQDEFGVYLRSSVRTHGSGEESFESLSGGATPLLAYPARKQPFEGPFIHAFSAFHSSLGSTDEDVTLVVIGYSFRDAHFLRALWDASLRNRDLRVVLLDPDAERIYRKILAVTKGAKGTSPRPSPLANRVFRISLPVDENLNILRDLPPTLQNYHQARVAEQAAKRGQFFGTHSWTSTLHAYFKAGDLGQYYAIGEIAHWRGLHEAGEPHALLRDLLRELVLVIESRCAAPERRQLPSQFARVMTALGDTAHVGVNQDTFHLAHIRSRDIFNILDQTLALTAQRRQSFKGCAVREASFTTLKSLVGEFRDWCGPIVEWQTNGERDRREMKRTFPGWMESAMNRNSGGNSASLATELTQCLRYDLDTLGDRFREMVEAKSWVVAE